jgi:hypothetical protein
LKYLAEDAVALADVEQTLLIATIDAPLRQREQQIIKLITKHYPHIKIALIPRGNHDLPKIIERLMYFSFDEKLKYSIISTASAIQAEAHTISDRGRKSRKPKTFREIYASIIGRPMLVISFAFFLVIVIHTIFLVPLAVSVLSTAWQGSRIIGKQTEELKSSGVVTDPFSYPSGALSLAQRLYTPIRRGWLFLGLSAYPERVMDVTKSAIEMYRLSQRMREDSSIMIAKMFDPKVVAQDQILQKKALIIENLQSAQDNLHHNLQSNYLHHTNI